MYNSTTQHLRISGKNADSWARQAVKSEKNNAAYSHSVITNEPWCQTECDCRLHTECGTMHTWGGKLAFCALWNISRASLQEYECIREKRKGTVHWIFQMPFSLLSCTLNNCWHEELGKEFRQPGQRFGIFHNGRWSIPHTFSASYIMKMSTILKRKKGRWWQDFILTSWPDGIINATR